MDEPPMPVYSGTGMQGNPQFGMQRNPQFGMQGNPQFGMRVYPPPLRRHCRSMYYRSVRMVVGLLLLAAIIGIIYWAIKYFSPSRPSELYTPKGCDNGRECDAPSCFGPRRDTYQNYTQAEAESGGKKCKSSHCVLDDKLQLVCAPNPNPTTTPAGASSLTYAFLNVIIVFLGVIQHIQIQIA